MNRKTALAAALGCALLAAPVGASSPAPQAAVDATVVPESSLVATAAELTQDPVVVPAARTAREWVGEEGEAVTPEHVPTVVLDAYTTAVAVAPASCHMTVPLLAAVGQVESGNLVGRQLSTDHAVTPAMVGPRLDGGAFKAVGDTDAGRLDGDKKFDRAVGPMQFLPSTWRSVGVDMDGDGTRDPQNVYDAAGAAMVYLCGSRDLSDPAQLRRAILSYNRSAAYVQQVLTWKQTFETKGLGAVASLPIFSASATGPATTGGAALAGGVVSDGPIAKPRKPKKGPKVRKPGSPSASPSPRPGTTPSNPPSPTPGGTPTPGTTPSPTGEVLLSTTTAFESLVACPVPADPTLLEITQDVFGILVFTDASHTLVTFPRASPSTFANGATQADPATFCQAAASPSPSPSGSPSPSPSGSPSGSPSSSPSGQ